MEGELSTMSIPAFGVGQVAGPRMSILAAAILPLLSVFIVNEGFRQALPLFLRGKADWPTTVDNLASNSVLATLLGVFLTVIVISSFLQAITTVGLVVRGVLLLAGIAFLVNIVSIDRIDGYIDTRFLGAEAAAHECSSGFQIGGFGDSIRATLKGSSGSLDPLSSTLECGVANG